jgi:MFS family permease
MVRISPKATVSVVFVVAMFMAIMDTTIVNVALPTISRDLSVPLNRVDGVAVGFLVSLAVFIPASGWLGDRFGTKRVFLAALAIFTAASALCGLADSFAELVAFRVLQGVGGGMLTPTGMAMLYRAYPPAERVRASRILTAPTAFAPAWARWSGSAGNGGVLAMGVLRKRAHWRTRVRVRCGVLARAPGRGRRPVRLARLPARRHRPGDPDVRAVRGVLPGVGFSAHHGDRARRRHAAGRPDPRRDTDDGAHDPLPAAG